MERDLIAHDELLRVLAYNPETETFTWKVTISGVNAGASAGWEHHGYVKIGIHRIEYRAHRLAWFYVHGEWPDRNIDHVNRDRSDNRLSNLRLASQTQNLRNASVRSDNTSGFRGVSWNKRQKKWNAYITVDKRLHLGTFEEVEDAATAYNNAARRYFGEFANLNEINEGSGQ